MMQVNRSYLRLRNSSMDRPQHYLNGVRSNATGQAESEAQGKRKNKIQGALTLSVSYRGRTGGSKASERQFGDRNLRFYRRVRLFRPGQFQRLKGTIQAHTLQNGTKRRTSKSNEENSPLLSRFIAAYNKLTFRSVSSTG